MRRQDRKSGDLVFLMSRRRSVLSVSIDDPQWGLFADPVRVCSDEGEHDWARWPKVGGLCAGATVVERGLISRDNDRHGSSLLMVVFVTALLGAVVIGYLQMNTEEIQLMQNHVYGAEALATAEAGLNDALAQLRSDSSWDTGFSNKAFNGGSYTVMVDGTSITATATTSRGFVARVQAELTISSDGPPYVIRIDTVRVNE